MPLSILAVVMFPPLGGVATLPAPAQKGVDLNLEMKR